jgi:hypothetical protein
VWRAPLRFCFCQGQPSESKRIQYGTVALSEHYLCLDLVCATIGENKMPLVTVVIALAIVGLLLWLVNRYIPMQSQIKSILNAVVVIAVILWLLKVFGLFGYLTQFRVGH